MQYNGDLGNGFFQSTKTMYGFGGLSVNRYLGKVFDLSLLFTKGEVGYTSENGKFSSGLSTATLNLRFNLLKPESAIRPYLFLGGGVLMFSINPTDDGSKIDFAAPSFGAGLNFRLGESIMFQVQELFINSTNDNKDGIKLGTNDFFVLHTIGLTFNFGKKHDEDADGVADRDDKCASTPSGVAVDILGCPLDKDKDGVVDYLDACPDVAGLATFKGCPDKDEDGIEDKQDRCPEIKGALALKGCPDTDNDGVADLDDKCADTKTGYKVDATGCTVDNDKDGIVNEEDRCADAFGLIGLKGCPDADGDGVADMDDRCPAAMGTITNKGCPEMKVEDIKKITQIASKIFFETASDKLKVASLVQLDELSEILKRYPEANLTIEGHTDDVGKDDYNMTLSQKRTESVKVYLMGKGIFESKLTAIGYGETKPIADNTTTLGKAKNRRVELKTQY
jgi:outer membrane protein OmpA-like peptidoglycan-associated protein